MQLNDFINSFAQQVSNFINSSSQAINSYSRTLSSNILSYGNYYGSSYPTAFNMTVVGGACLSFYGAYHLLKDYRANRHNSKNYNYSSKESTLQSFTKNAKRQAATCYNTTKQYIFNPTILVPAVTALSFVSVVNREHIAATALHCFSAFYTTAEYNLTVSMMCVGVVTGYCGLKAYEHISPRIKPALKYTGKKIKELKNYSLNFLDQHRAMLVVGTSFLALYRFYDFVTPIKTYLEAAYQNKGNYLTSLNNCLDYGSVFARENVPAIGATVLALGIGYAVYRYYFRKYGNRDFSTYLRNRPKDFAEFSDEQRQMYYYGELIKLLSKPENQLTLKHLAKEGAFMSTGDFKVIIEKILKAALETENREILFAIPLDYVDFTQFKSKAYGIGWGANKQTILHHAVQGENGSFLQESLKQAKERKLKLSCVEFINAQDSRGMTALHYACANFNTEIVAILLLNGANPDIKDGKGLYPVQHAAGDTKISKMFKIAHDNKLPEFIREGAREDDQEEIAQAIKTEIEKQIKIQEESIKHKYIEANKSSPDQNENDVKISPVEQERMEKELRELKRKEALGNLEAKVRAQVMAKKAEDNKLLAQALPKQNAFKAFIHNIQAIASGVVQSAKNSLENCTKHKQGQAVAKQ